MEACGVYTLEDEAAWEHAKQIANREYPDATGSNYWRVVRGIFTAMTESAPKSTHSEHATLWRMTR